jgi:hypothetical protein
VRPEIGGTLLLNARFEFLRHKIAAIGIEVPIAVHGSRRSDVFARGGYAGFYTERLAVVLTPGVRVRFATERWLSPWPSFGAGLTTIRRTGVDFSVQPAGCVSARLESESRNGAWGRYRHPCRTMLVPSWRIAQLSVQDTGLGLCFLVSFLESLELQPCYCGKRGVPIPDLICR